MENSVYCKILFTINIRGVTAFGLAKELNKKQAVMWRQLKELENKKLLLSKREKKLNKKIYLINWEKIIEEFVKFLKDARDYTFSEAKRIAGKKGIEALKQDLKTRFVYYSYLDDKRFIFELKNNPYLIIFFRMLFKEMARMRMTQTKIVDLFGIMLVKEMRPHPLSKIDDILFHKYQEKVAEVGGISDKDIKEDKEKVMKRIHKELNEEMGKAWKKHREEYKRIENKDKHLRNLKDLANVMHTCNYIIGCEDAIWSAIHIVNNTALKKYFNEKELKEYYEWQEDIRTGAYWKKSHEELKKLRKK